MKTLALITLLGASLLVTTGCGTPGYTSAERHQQIARNWNYEFGQATDDVDHVLLLRPVSKLTVWNVR